MSWRWTIRYACLTLLVLCVGLWVLSYFYAPCIKHIGSFTVLQLEVEPGGLLGAYFDSSRFSRLPQLGWSVQWYIVVPGPVRPYEGVLEFIIAHRFSQNYSYVGVSLWFPTALLALVSLIAWRKTAQHKLRRGFPVEPMASPQEKVGG